MKVTLLTILGLLLVGELKAWWLPYLFGYESLLAFVLAVWLSLVKRSASAHLHFR